MFGVALGAVTDTGVLLRKEHPPEGHAGLLYDCSTKPDDVGGFAATKYEPVANPGEVYRPCASVVANTFPHAFV
jgi:hypothetical protein